MEKIDHLHMTDGCRRTDEMLAWKVNEIVDWINERSERVGRIEVQKWINEHDQARGEKEKGFT